MWTFFSGHVFPILDIARAKSGRPKTTGIAFILPTPTPSFRLSVVFAHIMLAPRGSLCARPGTHITFARAAPCNQSQGICCGLLSRTLVRCWPDRLSRASSTARLSTSLWRLTASLKRKAVPPLSGACPVKWRCKMILFRKYGLAAILAMYFRPKRNSSNLRVIQKKCACFSGSAPAGSSSSSSAVTLDNSERKGVTPTPAPTAISTSDSSDPWMGAEYGPSTMISGRESRMPDRTSWHALASACVQSPTPAMMKSSVDSLRPEQIVKGCHWRGAYSGMQRKAYMPALYLRWTHELENCSLSKDPSGPPSRPGLISTLSSRDLERLK
mmetsp:Transcript_74553/g.230403  ORF Transcript_74553/g.230403 Transcript_74553/m.230403 type:complete len:327 (-) Transcript_74553:311-1291(-)